MKIRQPRTAQSNTLLRPAFWLGLLLFILPLMAILAIIYIEAIVRHQPSGIVIAQPLVVASCSMLCYFASWYFQPYIPRRQHYLYNIALGIIFGTTITLALVATTQFRQMLVYSEIYGFDLGYFFWRDIVKGLNPSHAIIIGTWAIVNTIFAIIVKKFNIRTHDFPNSQPRPLLLSALAIRAILVSFTMCAIVLISIWQSGKPNIINPASRSSENLHEWTLSNQERNEFYYIRPLRFSIPKGFRVDIKLNEDFYVYTINSASNFTVLKLYFGNHPNWPPPISPFSTRYYEVIGDQKFDHAFLWCFRCYHHEAWITPVGKDTEWGIHAWYKHDNLDMAALADRIIASVKNPPND